MKKEKIQQCIQLTDDIMTTHFRGDHRLLVQHLHKDCLWIGARAEEYFFGRDVILGLLDEEKKEIPDITLTSKEFQLTAQDRSSCVITGRYIGVTDESSKELYRDMQRVTFSWKEEKEKFLITHMHVSNPMSTVVHDEVFPHQIGTFTREYLDMLIKKEVEKSGYLTVKDRDSVVHKLQISNILYLEAFNVNTLIHTVDGDIFARASITGLEQRIREQQEDLFVRVHKSFCVNRFYVTSIRTYELRLAGRYTVPVSKGRYLEVKEHLHM